MGKADECGGAESVEGVYLLPDSVKSSDKGGHKERSRFHQPNHERHWRKVERQERIERLNHLFIIL